jgi:hypothetical protein
MSLAVPSKASNLEQARSESIGYLALTHMGQRLPLQVCRSTAGYYIGTIDVEQGPASRESVQYFQTNQEARDALVTGQWQQRFRP